MDCKEITEIPVVQRAISNPGEASLLNRIYHCIYERFCGDFIKWIVANHSGKGIDKSESEEMARDAFQEGLIKFTLKTRENGLKQQNATLRTVIFSFCYMCFRGIYTKRGREIPRVVSFDEIIERSPEENSISSQAEETAFGEGKTYLDEIMEIELSEEEYNLYRAIRLLPNANWRKAVMMRYFDNLKSVDIAERLNVTRGAVDNMISDARKELKVILETKFNFLK